MDYEIRRKKSDLDSTGYMEVGLGKYSGNHWQVGFLFVWEDAFGMAEGIVLKHFKDYDHFEMNDIPKNVGKLIAADWKKAASSLESADQSEFQKLLNLDAVFRTHMAAEVSENKDSIIALLNELARSFEQYYEKEEWVCILGM